MPEFGLEATTTRVELHDEDGRTRLTVTGGPYTDEMRGNAETGWSQQLDKLARLLGGAA
jgi:hypothetical protein